MSTRDVTSGFTAELDDRSKRPIALFEALFDSGPLRLWTGYGELPWDSRVWTGSGKLLRVTPVEETADVRAPGAVFVLSGVPASIIDLVSNEPYQGRTVRQYLGFLDAAGTVIPDPYELRRYLIDTMEDMDDGETATVTMTAENALAGLERVVERRYTPEDQAMVDPSDTFFDFVADLQDRPIVGRR